MTLKELKKGMRDEGWQRAWRHEVGNFHGELWFDATGRNNEIFILDMGDDGYETFQQYDV